MSLNLHKGYCIRKVKGCQESAWIATEVTLVPQLSIHTNEAIKISFSVAVIDVSFILRYNKTPTRTGRGLVCHFFGWFLWVGNSKEDISIITIIKRTTTVDHKSSIFITNHICCLLRVVSIQSHIWFSFIVSIDSSFRIQ